VTMKADELNPVRDDETGEWKPNERLSHYWVKHYATDGCTLCGNSGIIDTRGLKSPAGRPFGRLNYCICPNGQIKRAVRREMC